MPSPPINIQQKLKISLKTAISKLRFIQEKKTALAKQQRRQLADLLNQGKESSATIRVENIIRDDIYVELLEYLELYCELLLARLALVTDMNRTTCDSSIKDAVQSIIFAASHSELKEMMMIKELLILRYGSDFGHNALENLHNEIPEKIVKRCESEPPSETLVRLYLSEIAKTYKAPYSQMVLDSDDEIDNRINNDVSSDSKIAGKQPETASDSIEGEPSQKATEIDEFDALKARFAALKGN